jgi:predicted DNA-binding transcriptional regulator AlpA
MTTLLTIAETCKRRCSSRSQFYRDIAAGKVKPPVKRGRRSYKPEDEVEEEIQRDIAASRATT